MTGNRALLTNFVEKFLGTVRFGNNDFAVIAGYGDAVIVQNGFCFEQASLSSSHGFVWTDARSSINGKRYVLVVVDDYSRYTWVFFLHSNDKASEVIISFIKITQVNLQLQVQRVRTDNGTKFKNKTLTKFFDEVGITQQFSAARTPQQNGVVERRNRTLVEAARTMLTFANLPSFLWAKAIAAACLTQNRSIIHKRFDKTHYELIYKRKPNIKFFRVLGCRCYLLNDYEDVGKLKAKGDIGVFVGYSKESATFRITTNELIMNSSTTNVKTPINEEVFHEEFASVLTSEFEKVVNMFVKIDGVIEKRLKICLGDPFIRNFMMTISDKMKETSQLYLKRADEVFNIIRNVRHLTTTRKGGQPKTPIFESPTFLKEIESSFEKEMQNRHRLSFEAPSFSFGFTQISPDKKGPSKDDNIDNVVWDTSEIK
nr:retrovirus-related Pol polyprotein from transposon TNT 1-94 [Tanacetum cinerariifolium]